MPSASARRFGSTSQVPWPGGLEASIYDVHHAHHMMYLIVTDYIYIYILYYIILIYIYCIYMEYACNLYVSMCRYQSMIYNGLRFMYIIWGIYIYIMYICIQVRRVALVDLI